MINSFRINESVLDEMRRAGVGRKINESKMSELDAEDTPADEKSSATEIPYKKGHYQFTFKTSKGKDSKWVRRIYKGDDMNALHDKAKAQAKRDYPESHGHVMHSPQTDESVKESMSSMRADIDNKMAGAKEARQKELASAPGLPGILKRLMNLEDSELLKLQGWLSDKIAEKQLRDSRMRKAKGFAGHINDVSGLSVKEGEDEKEGLEDKQFDAPTGSEISDLDKKNAGIDQGHDEAGEEQDDPTREKLETPQDEKDEQKGGAAELAADLRVSVRIEKMNLNRYKRMLDKHDLSEDGQGWLKEKIQDIQSMIDDMLERIPQLEKEAEEQSSPEEAKVEMQEHMRSKLRKAIVEIAG